MNLSARLGSGVQSISRRQQQRGRPTSAAATTAVKLSRLMALLGQFNCSRAKLTHRPRLLLQRQLGWRRVVLRIVEFITCLGAQYGQH